MKTLFFSLKNNLSKSKKYSVFIKSENDSKETEIRFSTIKKAREYPFTHFDETEVNVVIVADELEQEVVKKNNNKHRVF